MWFRQNFPFLQIQTHFDEAQISEAKHVFPCLFGNSISTIREGQIAFFLRFWNSNQNKNAAGSSDVWLNLFIFHISLEQEWWKKRLDKSFTSFKKLNIFEEYCTHTDLLLFSKLSFKRHTCITLFRLFTVVIFSFCFITIENYFQAAFVLLYEFPKSKLSSFKKSFVL